MAASRKCPECRGTGEVMKYIAPEQISSVRCLGCRGLGWLGRLGPCRECGEVATHILHTNTGEAPSGRTCHAFVPKG